MDWRITAAARAGRISYQAGSQGGWVAPLAAKIAPVDFVIVGFGLAVSALGEDREAIALDMTSRGYDPMPVLRSLDTLHANGTRVDTRNPDGYFQMMRDFIMTGRLQKRYSTSTVFAPVAPLQ
jgi:uncharacterized protein